MKPTSGSVLGSFPSRAERQPGTGTARHFAQLSYSWGSGIPAKEAGFLHGSIAVSPSPEMGPTPCYSGVFDRELQDSVDLLQEGGILRRDGHYFSTKRDWTATSYRVYGDVTKRDKCTYFIGVEPHVHGAVSVYFREYTTAATVDELAGWWILRAWRMALEVHLLLGTTGNGHLAVLFDAAKLSGPPGRKSSLVEFGYGPFSLRSDSKVDRNQLVVKGVTSIRAAILHGLDVDWREDAAAGSRWSPSEVQTRLGTGRGKDSRRGIRRRMPASPG